MHTKIILLCLCLMFFSRHCLAQQEQLRAPGATLQLHWNAGFTASEKDKVRSWLTRVVDGNSKLFGRFPIPEAEVEIRKSNSRRGPVPWGQVLRGDPDGVLLVVNPDYPLETILFDWTAAHEFSHLFIPYPGDRDIWFTEGLATYLQNVLQTRNRVYTDQIGWQKLYEGFMRGSKQAARQNTPLREASPNMWATRGYMRVYWTGAAYFLLADTQLLQQSAGSQGLAEVLDQFSACCLQHSGKWSARRLASKFDQLSGTRVFSQLYAECIDDTSLPPWQDAFTWLGISASAGRVQLSPETVYQQRRQWIMTAR